MTKTSPIKIRRWATLALLISGVFLCLFYLLNLFRADSIVIEFSVYPLVSIFLLYFCSILLNVMLWRSLLHAMTGHTISNSLALAGTASLMIGKYIPGKVLGLVGRITSVPHTIASKTAANAALIEQAYLVTSLFILSLFALLLRAELYFLTVLFLFLVLGIMYFPSTVGRYFEASHRIKISAYGNALLRITPRISLKVFFFAFLAAVFIASIAWFAVDLLGLELQPRERLGIIGAYAIGITVGMLVIIVPAGIGIREASFVLLAQIWIGAEQAMALAALLRLINVIADLMAGIIGLTVTRLRQE